jgi:hypothetical protein
LNFASDLVVLQAVPLCDEELLSVSGTTLALTIDTPVLGESLSWNALESCMVEMSHQVPARALALVLQDAQERLIEAVCGRRWTPVAGAVVPFACPGVRDSGRVCA